MVSVFSCIGDVMVSVFSCISDVMVSVFESGQLRDYTIVIGCFSATNTALMRKSLIWTAMVYLQIVYFALNSKHSPLINS
jgi:hypothetical protein